jgi:hypothetical protein
MANPTCAALLGCALLAAAGCTTAVSGHAAPAATTATVAPTTTAAPTPTAAPPSTTPPGPAAADGIRYAACADGSCQVGVYRPVRITVRGNILTVTRMLADGFDYRVALANGASSSGSLRGHCTLRLTGGGGGLACSLSSQPPAPREAGVFLIQLQGMAGRNAVIRLLAG